MGKYPSFSAQISSIRVICGLLATKLHLIILNNHSNACRFRGKVVTLHRNSTEGMGD